jgi:hypothetical protein
LTKEKVDEMASYHGLKLTVIKWQVDKTTSCNSKLTKPQVAKLTKQKVTKWQLDVMAN